MARFLRWLLSFFEEPKPEAKHEDSREAALDAWGWKAIAEIVLGDASALMPSCHDCQTKPETAHNRACVEAALHSWALFGTAADHVRGIVELTFPPCASCQLRYDPAKVYERIVLLMRCWATNGGSPHEIQAVLDAAAAPLGVKPLRWM